MTKQHHIFFDDWRACLYAHYIHVIRTGDMITEPTLRQVLLHAGLSEDDLIALQQEALESVPLDSDAAPDSSEALRSFYAAPPEPDHTQGDALAEDDDLDESEPEDDAIDEVEPDWPDEPPSQLSLF